MNEHTLPEPTPTERKMMDVLSKIWNHDDFIFGIRVTLKTDELRQEMADAIKDGDIVTSDDAILYAVQLAEEDIHYRRL
ncbi:MULTISPECIES: hypothetical protein [unclassified Acidaminococcus]|uniref:hypothetical protein n=1 Tax=unclassified Acidaminococcus TaxID=2635771 RepID=UPI0025906A95|nr:hypothetical protein [Acidaminococcus sp. CAG:542]